MDPNDQIRPSQIQHTIACFDLANLRVAPHMSLRAVSFPIPMVLFPSICGVRSFGHAEVGTRGLTRHCRSRSTRTAPHAHDPGQRSIRLPRWHSRSARDPLSFLSEPSRELGAHCIRACPFSLQKKHWILSTLTSGTVQSTSSKMQYNIFLP